MPAAANTASASATIWAPAAVYSSSVIAEPVPAPACTTTSWPACTNSRTPSGVAATRYSWFLTSVGMPMITSRLQVVQGGPQAAGQLLELSVGQHERRGDLQRSGRERPRHDAVASGGRHEPADERGVGVEAVGIDLHRGEHAGPTADLAHNRVTLQRRERLCQRTLERLRSHKETLVLQDVEVRQRAGRDRCVAAVGIAVSEHAGPFAPERLPDDGRRDHRSERQVPARDPLGTGDEVGLEPE